MQLFKLNLSLIFRQLKHDFFLIIRNYRRTLAPKESGFLIFDILNKLFPLLFRRNALHCYIHTILPEKAVRKDFFTAIHFLSLTT